MNAKKSIVIGATIGLFIAAITVLCATLNNAWDNERLRSMINFIAAVPTLILSGKLNLLQALQNALFFVYWAVVGGLFGILLVRKTSFIKTTCVLIALVSFVIVHRAVQVTLEAELRDALRGLETLFTGKAYLKEVK